MGQPESLSEIAFFRVCGYHGTRPRNALPVEMGPSRRPRAASASCSDRRLPGAIRIVWTGRTLASYCKTLATSRDAPDLRVRLRPIQM